MDATDNSILFSDNFSDSRLFRQPDKIVHILCNKGYMSFSVQHVRYNVACGDYVILPPGMIVSDISQSDDCSAMIMSFNEALAVKSAIQNDYGVIGHLSLLQNPVIRLDDAEYSICLEDMRLLKERSSHSGHLFYNEMITSLLKVHILDLYHIHAKANKDFNVSSRPAELMREFIRMLMEGAYRTRRDLEYYSSTLCITSHYLSEVSIMVSKRPASYWIDLFVTNELSRLLIQKDLTLTDIALRLNFSSTSYLSRYVRKHFGMTPSEFRKTLK